MKKTEKLKTSLIKVIDEIDNYEYYQKKDIENGFTETNSYYKNVKKAFEKALIEYSKFIKEV